MDNLYASVAQVLKLTIAKKTSLRTAVYNSKFNNKKQLLRLSCETLKYKAYLEKIFNAQNVMRHFLKNEKLMEDNCLCLVLLYEMVFGKGVNMREKNVQRVVFAAKKDIMAENQNLSDSGVSAESCAPENSNVMLPRYIRINTLITTEEEAIQSLAADGFELVEVEVKTRKQFRKAVENLEKNQFFQDRHIPNLLIFHPSTDLHHYEQAPSHAFILQDKASCLSAFVLDAPEGSTAMDCCAAPGNKTSHLAALMNNKGELYAFDKDQKRLQTLQNRMEKAQVTIVKAQAQDFLRLDVDQYSNVEYVILDPPCSGTGMLKRGQFLHEEVDEKRIRGLANLQSMLLKHALKLPTLKRLVYSTCSTHELENEGVVQEVLNEEFVKENYELVNPLTSWKSRGKEGYEFSELCLRADPKVDLTNGFFVVLFQRK